MILDTIRPYLAVIRIFGYCAIIAFVFVSGCNIGKHKQTVKIAKLETDLGVCQDANKGNIATIKALRNTNALYAADSAEQAKAVDKAQKSLKVAEKRAYALEKASKRKAESIYRKNKEWAEEKVPDGISELLNEK